MRLGRIRERFSAHDWFSVAVELLIVVVGVLIAMQVANWNQARTERERGGQYFHRIVSELENHRTDMRARAHYFRQVIGHAEAALAALDRPASQLGEPFLIDLYQASQIIIGPISHSSYDEALATGSLQYVGDAALRARLSNHYDGVRGTADYLDVLPPYRDHIRQRLPYDVQQLIWARCDDVIRFDSSGLGLVSLPETCSLGLSRQRVAAAVAAVRSMPNLKDELTRQLSDLHTRLNQVEGVENSASELITNMQR